jgi:hypothetical protein
VLCIIAANTVICACYLAVAFWKKSPQMKISGFIMLLTPPAGAIYFLGQYILMIIWSRENQIQLEDISFSKERRSRVLSPDEESEIQSAPLEEVFLVSTSADRRKKLLFELKKESIATYAAIKKAYDNDDPETSHYAASAISSVKTEFQNKIREFDSQYARDSQNTGLIREYSDHVLEFFKSDTLEDMEMKKYSFLYLNLMTPMDNAPGFLTGDDYVNIVNEAISVGEYGTAEYWAELSFAAEESERNYLSLLKVYYCISRPDKFFLTLGKLKKSDVLLSERGLALVRFFGFPPTPPPIPPAAPTIPADGAEIKQMA